MTKQDQINNLTALLEHALCFVGKTPEAEGLWDKIDEENPVGTDIIETMEKFAHQREACITLIRVTLATDRNAG